MQVKNQIYIMKKEADDFINLHSKQIVGEEALSQKKAHFCSSSEEVKIRAESDKIQTVNNLENTVCEEMALFIRNNLCELEIISVIA